MTSASKVEQIIKIVENYTEKLVFARSNYQNRLNIALLSDEPVDNYPTPPKDEDFTAVADTILFRIKGVLDDSTI